MKQSIIAVIPAFNYYTEISVKADKFAVRLSCQIDNSIKDKYNFVFFDQYIDKHLAQKYNKKAISESLNHAIGENGNCSNYKGLSLVDIDFAAIWTNVFLPCYRDALAFLSLVEIFSPSKIIIEANDPNRDIFKELADQMKVEIYIVQSLGNVNENKKELIKNSNRAFNPQEFNWHPPLRKPMWEQVLTSLFNYWSKLIRVIRGRKPFVFIDHSGHLSHIRSQLSRQKDYYPVFFKLIKLPIIDLLFSGPFILPYQDLHRQNSEIYGVIKTYKKHLESMRLNKKIGQIEYKNKRYSITGSIVSRLEKMFPYAFEQIAGNIDICESFVNKNGIKGALMSGDLPWAYRIIIRLFQKHGLGNMALPNGLFGPEHQIENKSLDKVLCIGDSCVNNYFKGGKNVIVGSPRFDIALKKRALTMPEYPIRKILLTTIPFSTQDINSHYNDSEIFLGDILKTIKKYCKQNHCELHVALKPHPSDYIDFYSWYLKKSGFPGMKVISGSNYQDVVSNYDLVIASGSNTLIEAAAMGIPVIFYHCSNRFLGKPFDGSCPDLPAAFSLEELEKTFARVMKDREFAYKFTDVESLKPFAGEMDGNSPSRIIEEVVKMAKAG